ncbi:SusC/RagA family TonB-linked outer membrane protein [Faecalibacter rhinopitheci]|uniref:SusC/RagA family TonB-linked outer membrane protein n=1 Tax=Faecalibacter rhinopitheci TaxID=2779678 RepID=A0A8J7FSX4_9FLAO|nr:SusC/RagA family TonB-linked outer membrane protein [Faecalibacter rhinopitheci]MBF0598333.1 SusC/RagA family TonB-linked outer membrane protein [Faecalibacter rhinopitheci]
MKKNHFKIGGNALSVILSMICATPMLAQVGKTVHGTVKEQSISLSGVLVTEKGTENHTFTDDYGRYDITLVTPNATLVFETPELLVREEEVKNRSSISIEFDTEGIGLQEVVVNAGYYTVKDKERTGSIARVTAKEIENQPVNNVLSAIQGRMAGVSIVQNSGVAGGGYDIQIRGKNSLRREGNDPLYIVDGIALVTSNSSNLSGTIIPYASINPLNTINPNNIESIEVLKDADATAIYGSRGANGVVLITTKTGKNRKTEFSFNSSYSISKVANKMKLMNTEQYLNMRKLGFQNSEIVTYPANAYDVNGRWNENSETDWQKELIGGLAAGSLYEIGLSGGNDQTTYVLNAKHQEQTTVFPTDNGIKSNYFNANINHKSKDQKLTIFVNTSYNLQSNTLPTTDLTSKALRLAPNAPTLYNVDGSLNWEGGSWTNPVAALHSIYKNDTKNLLLNTNFGYQISDNFSIKLNAGLNDLSFMETSIRPHTLYNPANGITSANSTSSKGTNQSLSYVVEPQLNWNKQLNKFTVDALVGTSLQNATSDYFRVTGTGFSSDELIYNLSAAKTQTINQNSKVEYSYASLFTRFNVKYADKYILNLTARRDGSSRFGPNNRFANFGAIGGAWIFSKENLFNESAWLSFGKLRGSFGITGSDQIGDYQYLDTYTIGSTKYDEITGMAPSRLYNPNFSWEKTQKLELALELGFLRDRLNFSMAYYQNKSGNQLVGIPLPGTTGFSSIQSNLNAVIQNTGLEFELDTHLIKKQHFKWSSSFNLSIPKNKLESFPNLEGSTYANTYVIGKATTIQKLYHYEGIDPVTGLYRFKDYNGDGIISPLDDQQSIKEVGMNYYGGWSNSLRYKKIELSFLFQFVKQTQFNYDSNYLAPGSLNNQPIEMLDAWSTLNPNSAYTFYYTTAKADWNKLSGLISQSDKSVSDASYIRLKNITISYQLPSDKTFWKNAMIYFQGQNLLTFTNYYGLDPEFVLTGFLPPLKTYSFGLQFKF